MRPRSMTLLAFSALLASGCASAPSEPDPGPSEDLGPLVHEHRGELRVNQMYEVDMFIARGNSIQVSFTASPAVNWDLHSHNRTTGQTEIHHQGRASQRTLAFVSMANGAYSLDLLNSGNPGPATVALTIRGNATFLKAT